MVSKGKAGRVTDGALYGPPTIAGGGEQNREEAVAEIDISPGELNQEVKREAKQESGWRLWRESSQR